MLAASKARSKLGENKNMAVGVQLSVKMRDTEGAIYSVPFYLDNTVNTVAAAEGIANTLATTLNGISNCGVIAAEANFRLGITGGAIGTPQGNSRIDAGATFSLYNSASRAGSIYVPGISLLLASDGEIDLDDSDVAAFINALIDPGAKVVDENGLKWVDKRKAYLSTRKTRK